MSAPYAPYALTVAVVLACAMRFAPSSSTDPLLASHAPVGGVFPDAAIW